LPIGLPPSGLHVHRSSGGATPVSTREPTALFSPSVPGCGGPPWTSREARGSAHHADKGANLPRGSSSSPSARRATARRNDLSCGLSCMLGAELRVRPCADRPTRADPVRARASGLATYAAAGAAQNAATQARIMDTVRILCSVALHSSFYPYTLPATLTGSWHSKKRNQPRSLEKNQPRKGKSGAIVRRIRD